jgi:hypothetical protein
LEIFFATFRSIKDLRLFFPLNEEDDLGCPVENRKGQSHPVAADCIQPYGSDRPFGFLRRRPSAKARVHKRSAASMRSDSPSKI